ncbi:hypothetical protein AAFN86_08955 [Roseomonas sp. CAU 1739]|uniref:hypothetical protein n=1 Tax=Roseomonas sp. CAU 1739 TaxID=3140364 RepID=UPI00325A8350
MENIPSKAWTGGAAMADALLNKRMTVRPGAEVAFAQIGIVGFDGQIELEALRLLRHTRATNVPSFAYARAKAICVSVSRDAFIGSPPASGRKHCRNAVPIAGSGSRFRA